jgi:hypothetical protein
LEVPFNVLTSVGLNKSKDKEAKEREDQHNLKELIVATNAVAAAITSCVANFEKHATKNEKSDHSKFLMQLSDRHKNLGDDEKAAEHLDQAAVVLSLSIATETPTENQQAEDAVVANLLSHKGSGALESVMEEDKNQENSSDGMPEARVVQLLCLFDWHWRALTITNLLTVAMNCNECSTHTCTSKQPTTECAHPCRSTLAIPPIELCVPSCQMWQWRLQLQP